MKINVLVPQHLLQFVFFNVPILTEMFSRSVLTVLFLISLSLRTNAQNPFDAFFTNLSRDFMDFVGNVGRTLFGGHTKVCACDRILRPERSVDPKIVGGTVTAPHEYTELVIILKNGYVTCGGTVINMRFVLTAAHCVSNEDPSSLSVAVGGYDLINSESSIVIDVLKMTIHPKYNSTNYDYDAALLELHESIIFSRAIQPSCIELQDRDHEDQQATAVGWGKTAENGSISRVPQEVTVSIYNNTYCQNLYGRTTVISENMLCAGVPGGGKDSCGGDSGGPFFTSDADNPRLQIGIVSYGIGCARANRPGIYTRVSHLIDLLKTIPDMSSSCGIYSPDTIN